MNAYRKTLVLSWLFFVCEVLWNSFKFLQINNADHFSSGSISGNSPKSTTETIRMDFGQLVLLGSTICVMLTVQFSMKLLAEHVQNWKKPKEQKAIVIIILMAPIYAVDSYVGLINFFGSKAFFTFLDSIKECYEALVRFSYHTC